MIIRGVWGGSGAEVHTAPQDDMNWFFEQLALAAAEKPVDALEIDPGTRDEAVAMLRHFAACIRSGSDVPHVLARCLARQIDWALAQPNPGKAIAKAFGLSGARVGRPGKVHRDYKVYTRMVELIAAGAAVLDAAHTCAAEFNIHESNVQKNYYTYKAIFDSIPF